MPYRFKNAFSFDLLWFFMCVCVCSDILIWSKLASHRFWWFHSLFFIYSLDFQHPHSSNPFESVFGAQNYLTSSARNHKLLSFFFSFCSTLKDLDDKISVSIIRPMQSDVNASFSSSSYSLSLSPHIKEQTKFSILQSTEETNEREIAW